MGYFQQAAMKLNHLQEYMMARLDISERDQKEKYTELENLKFENSEVHLRTRTANSENIIELQKIFLSASVNIIALGHEFVVFRGNSGEVHVMDGFSAHLGANLGVGGKAVEVYG